MEDCCGTTCDKVLMHKELKLQGAVDFVEYMEKHITEDCSTEAVAELLEEWRKLTMK